MSMKIKTFLILTFMLFTFMSQAQTAVLPQSTSQCCGDNIVSVNGYGKIAVQPDIAIINIGASVTANLSQEATQRLADKISQLTKIFTNNKIADKDTQFINIYPQYDYPDGKQILIGQTASQTLQITVRNINAKGGILGTLIDQLVAVNGIQFNNLSFDKQSKSDAQKSARKLAFEDAKKKASQLASYADRTLGKSLIIVDKSGSSSPISYNNAASFSKAATTSVPVGTIDISYSLQVKFLLK